MKRRGFISLELISVLAIVALLSTFATLKALETHKEDVLQLLYQESTQIVGLVIATDNISSFVGFLRNGTNCLDGNTYDTTGTRVNIEKLKSCLGSDMGTYQNKVYDTDANSYFLHSALPCKSFLKGSMTSNSSFTMTLDCSDIEDAEYRTSVIKRMDDYTQTRGAWMSLYSSSSIDADIKILTTNLRF